MRERIDLCYNTEKWDLKVPCPEKTLQMFITNVCNKRCKGCFYDERLGKGHLDLESYKTQVTREKNLNNIKKMILLGGEPTAHPQLLEMLALNESMAIKTTVYTNGTLLHRLEENIIKANLKNVTWRIGVLGDTKTYEKSVEEVKTKLPITLVYMIRKDNMSVMENAVKMAEEKLNVNIFMMSSIRDIAETGSYWRDTNDTVSNYDYAQFVQNFVNNYDGKIKELHISRRGVLNGPYDQTTCRYLNVFPDGSKITCPLDISLNKQWEGDTFQERQCNKDIACLLQKLVLVRKQE